MIPKVLSDTGLSFNSYLPNFGNLFFFGKKSELTNIIQTNLLIRLLKELAHQLLIHNSSKEGCWAISLETEMFGQVKK